MSSSVCPMRATTLRARTIEILAAGNNLPQLDVDTLALPDLKLEVDARVAPLLGLIAGTALNSATEEAFADYVKRETPEDGEVLPVFDRHFDDIAQHLFMKGLSDLASEKGGQKYLGEIDYYIEAYYRRSPARETTDKLYKSTEELIGSGINTAGEHMPLLIFQLSNLGRCNGLDMDERIALTRRSGHLVAYLAKLKLDKLESYVDFINNFPDTRYAMLSLAEREGEYVAHFNLRFLAAVKEDTPPEPIDHQHRPKHGCVAAVSGLLEEDTVVGEFWNWSVGVLEKAGYWEAAREPQD